MSQLFCIDLIDEYFCSFSDSNWNHNLIYILTVGLISKVEFPRTGIKHAESALAHVLSSQCVVAHGWHTYHVVAARDCLHIFTRV